MLHAHSFSNDILSRIQLLTKDGTLAALEPTGLVESTIKQVGDGYYPDGYFIAKAARICGLSPSWILEGTGSPYPVNYFDDDSAAEFLDELLAEISTIYLIVTEDGKFCVQTSVPTMDEVQGKWIQSHSTELISGDIGPATKQRVSEARQANNHKVSDVCISNMEFYRITGGWQRLAC